MASAHLELGPFDDLDQLAALEPEVTWVSISHRYRPFRLPRLPSQVRRLDLANVSLKGPVLFTDHSSDGLEELTLTGITTKVPMNKWPFPAPLRQLTYRRCQGTIDLRSVSSAKITLTELTGQPRVRLPEALDELTLAFIDAEAVTAIELPPYLRVLNLVMIGDGTEYQGLACPSLKELNLTEVGADVPITELYPGLETLQLTCYVPTKPIVLALPELRDLTIREATSAEPFELACPKLESLTVIASHEYEPPDLSRLENNLGQSLLRLVLHRVTDFPAATDWKELTSLTIDESPVDLPYMPWLDTLKQDLYMTTNGICFRGVDMYRRAWGLPIWA